MPTPGRPTDELLIQAARDHVRRLFGPSAAPRTITLQINGYDPLTLPVPPEPPPPAPAPAPFVPSAYQERIMEALAGKALTADQLADKVGDRRRLFRAGGIKELKEGGLVALHPRLGYYLPDDPPEEISQELS